MRFRARKSHSLRGSSRYGKKTRRSSRRVSRGRKRTYRKKRSMSKRSILNTTSRKKRNGMLSLTTTPASGGGNIPITGGPAIVQASAGTQVFLWNSTAQSLDASSVIPNQASRTATSCYMRGLSEHLRISTSTGLPWFHRRVCFTTKLTLNSAINAGATIPRVTFFDSANGIERLWFNMSRNNDTADQETLYGYLFRGQNGADWTDPIVAPTDPTRVTVRFDKTWTYRSGNTVGTVKETKLWHGMNKTLVYDDDESGEAESQSYYSTSAKPGMGNYFVVDIFSPLPGGSTSDLLRVDANSTLYWHER